MDPSIQVDPDTSLVEEIAIPVSNIPTAPNSRANSVLHLPSESRRGSTESQNVGYELHPIDPKTQINVNHLAKEGGSVIRDTKSGKHYKKVKIPLKVSSFRMS